MGQGNIPGSSQSSFKWNLQINLKGRVLSQCRNLQLFPSKCVKFESDKQPVCCQNLWVIWKIKGHKSYLSNKLQNAVSVCRAHLQNSWWAWEEGTLTAAALTALPVPARIQAAWAESGLKGGAEKGKKKKTEEILIPKFLLNQDINASMCTDEYLQNPFKMDGTCRYSD